MSDKSWIDSCNSYFKQVYDNLNQAVKEGSNWVNRNFKELKDKILWVWGVLEGDWNPNRSDGQIVADAILGFVPFLGQALDVRDLLACVYALHDERDKREAQEKWINLALVVMGTVPLAGDVGKAVLKIIFQRIRRFGFSKAGIDGALKMALSPIRKLMSDEQVIKVVGNNNIQKAYLTGAKLCRNLAGKVSAEQIIAQWRKLNSYLSGIIDQLAPYASVLPDGTISVLRGRLSDSVAQANKAQKPLASAANDVKSTLNQMAEFLEKESSGLQKAPVNSKTPVRVHETPPKKIHKVADKKRLKCFKPSDDKIGKMKKLGGKEYQQFEKEYYRQLKDQQEGLNGLTVDEYLLGRENYEKYGRGNGGAQKDARNQYEKKITSSLRESYEKKGFSAPEAKKMAKTRSQDILKELNALHNPDMIAGGKDKIKRLGNAGVNQSIGGQWAKEGRIKEMDAYAREMKAKHGGNATMNVELNRCK